jgi:arabinogalactan oligomer/maltooligosaccharide transport system permease protein
MGSNSCGRLAGNEELLLEAKKDGLTLGENKGSQILDGLLENSKIDYSESEKNDTFYYLSLSPMKKRLYRFLKFFATIGSSLSRFFKGIPGKLKKSSQKFGNIFVNIFDAFKYGDWKTRLSFVIMGFGSAVGGQILRGLIFFIFEVAFIFYMITFGGGYLAKFGTLGTVKTMEDEDGFLVVGDNSFDILLYGIVTMLIILCFVYTWYSSVKQAYLVQRNKELNMRLASACDDLKSLNNKNFQYTLLSLPMLGLIVFTVVPIIFMIFVAFTNYNNAHLPPKLFTWIGGDNFSNILFGTQLSEGDADTAKFSYTFGRVLLWTLIWAVLATFTNFFIGLFVAILINRKSIKLKKLWRTVLVTTIAVPQFISLLLMSKFLGNMGALNGLLLSWGWISTPIKWLDTPTLARVMVVVVNLWIGVPYTVLSCTGILMNVPDDLYEAAKIDGASPVKMFSSITMPYIMFVMGPSLISTFVGNINNFNVIFLLTGGGPYSDPAMSYSAGSTSLLITWLYKLTLNDKKYPQASVIGIMIFLIVAIFSLILYSRSSSLKNEENFQ